MDQVLPNDHRQLGTVGLNKVSGSLPVCVDMGPYLRQEGRYPPGNSGKSDSRSRVSSFPRRAQTRPDEHSPGLSLWVNWFMQKLRQPG